MMVELTPGWHTVPMPFGIAWGRLRDSLVVVPLHDRQEKVRVAHHQASLTGVDEGQRVIP